VSVVWKEETVVLVRDRVRVERTALGFSLMELGEAK
jgi:hypothetical protein